MGAAFSRGRGSLLYHDDATRARRDAAKRALEQRAETGSRTRLIPCSPWVIINIWVLLDYGAAKTTFGRVSKMLPGSSEVLYALGDVARREGHWDQSIAYFEQALALDPRNVELLMNAANTYAVLRQFPAALKLYDRVLDITPNDPDVMASKASIYQAQGNLQEAAKLLSGINWQTPTEDTFEAKITQLRLERNYGEADSIAASPTGSIPFDSEDKGRDQVMLAFIAAPCWRYGWRKGYR